MLACLPVHNSVRQGRRILLFSETSIFIRVPVHYLYDFVFFRVRLLWQSLDTLWKAKQTDETANKSFISNDRSWLQFVPVL